MRRGSPTLQEDAPAGGALARGRARAPVPVPTPRPLHGLTPRAFLIGLALIPPLCLWVEYAEIVAQATDLVAMSLSLAVIFSLFVLTLVNQGVRKLAPRRALSQAELMYIYIMLTVSVGIAGLGMIQFLNTTLGNVTHFATPENQWKTKIGPYLQPWLLPQPSALPDYYAGQSRLLTREHLLGWLLPVLAWSFFLCCLLGVMLCLNVIQRRQWIEGERLSFPTTTLPLEMTRDGSGVSLLGNRLMWIGFAIPAVLETLASINYLNPTVPFLPLKPSDPRLDLSPYFSQPPWSGVGYLALSFYPLVVGLIYFVPLDVAFSLWFFYLFAKLIGVAAVGLGYGDPGTGFFMNTSRVAYFGEQSAGAFIGLTAFGIYRMRRYLAGVFRTAFRQPGSLEDDNEPMPYRWAVFGAAAGLLLLTGFCMLMGMSWYVPLAFFVIYYLFITALTRIRAEAGLPWSFGPDMNPHQLMNSAVGVRAFRTPDLVGLASLLWFDIDYRCVAMPNQMEAFKIGEGARMNNRHIALAIVCATVVGILASWFAVLSCYYQYGAATAHVHSWRTDVGKFPWQTLQDWLNNPTPADAARLKAVGVGLVVVAGLTALRSQFLWWPFHPVGYALAGTFTMPWIWSSVFMGWLFKWIITRYGGMTAYRRLIPFFLGLILGDYITAGLWAVFGSATGIITYRAFPY